MKLILTLLTLLLASLSFAGPGHDHSHGHGHSHKADRKISKERTGEIGRTHIERLMKEKKLDSSWREATFNKSVIKNNEWLVTFDNKKSLKGKKLYIFLKKSGEFIAANFTGK